MRFLISFVLVSVISACIGFAIAANALAPRKDIGVSGYEAESKVTSGLEVSNLPEEAERLLASETAVAMSLLKEKGSKRIVINDSNFSRSARIVVARATFYDGGGPRKVTMHIDAFGDTQKPLASFPFAFESTGERQPLVARFQDLPAFKRFDFRFTHEGIELDPVGSDTDAPRVSPVSADAMLFHSDYSELRELLEKLGYIEAKSFEPSAMFGAVRRFRIDYQLDGPGFVSLRDLFALRIVNGMSSGKTVLLPYIEWSSGSEGGWMEDRESYKEIDPESELPAEERSSPQNVYEGADPAAENDIEFNQGTASVF